MNREQFRQRLTALGLDCKRFAGLSGYAEKTVYDFGARTPVPRIVRNYLCVLEQLQRHRVPLPPELEAPGHPHRATPPSAKGFRAPIHTP